MFPKGFLAKRRLTATCCGFAFVYAQPANARPPPNTTNCLANRRIVELPNNLNNAPAGRLLSAIHPFRPRLRPIADISSSVTPSRKPTELAFSTSTSPSRCTAVAMRRGGPHQRIKACREGAWRLQQVVEAHPRRCPGSSNSFEVHWSNNDWLTIQDSYKQHLFLAPASGQARGNSVLS